MMENSCKDPINNWIENLINRVDWETFKVTVQGELEKAQLTSVDMQTTKSYIRSIIRSSLSVYVDKPFLYSFKIDIKPFVDGRCTVILFYNKLIGFGVKGPEILAKWSLILEENLF